MNTPRRMEKTGRFHEVSVVCHELKTHDKTRKSREKAKTSRIA